MNQAEIDRITALYKEGFGASLVGDMARREVATAQLVNAIPSLLAAVVPLPVSGDREAMGIEAARADLGDVSVRRWTAFMESTKERYRRIGERLFSLGAASRDAELAALQASLATAESELDLALRNLDAAMTREKQCAKERGAGARKMREACAEIAKRARDAPTMNDASYIEDAIRALPLFGESMPKESNQ